MKAWHFLRSDHKLGYGDGRTVVVGETLEMLSAAEPKLCQIGMHGSVRVTDALKYAPGLTLCEVEIEGDIQEGNDKIVGRTRRVLRMIDATQIIVRFALICADRAKEHAKSAAESAKSAAESAAESAEYAAESAEYAAEYAAESAAKSAAKSAKYAAESAAESAEYAAESAEYAAEYAAESAAKSAAKSAKSAVKSECNEQEKILLSLVEEAFAAVVQL